MAQYLKGHYSTYFGGPGIRPHLSVQAPVLTYLAYRNDWNSGTFLLSGGLEDPVHQQHLRALFKGSLAGFFWFNAA